MKPFLGNVPDLDKGKLARGGEWRVRMYSDLFVFRSNCQEFPVRAEADTSNIQIASFISGFVSENTDTTIQNTKRHKVDRYRTRS